MLRVLPSILCALVWVFPVGARAHSPPFGVALSWVDPTSDGLPLIVTNRGLVFADGKTAEPGFSVRCNEGYGANTSDRPSAYLEANGDLTIGIYNQVYRTADRACSLTAGTGLPALPITSLLSAAGAPQRMYVATRSLQQQAGVFASEDHGRTFSERFKNKPDEYYEALVIAPSDAQRLYALGLHVDRANVQVIYYSSVSSDGGRSWDDHVVPAKIIPLGVHPTKPDVLFGYQPTDKLEITFDVLRSEDRGKTFKTVLPGVLMPTALVGAKDPSTLFLGVNGQGGLFRSLDDGLHFEPLIADQIQRITCLAAHGEKLWLCANIAPNLDAIWTLNESATGVDKVMSFDAIGQPVACEGPALATCAGPWYDFNLELIPRVTMRARERTRRPVPLRGGRWKMVGSRQTRSQKARVRGARRRAGWRLSPRCKGRRLPVCAIGGRPRGALVVVLARTRTAPAPAACRLTGEARSGFVMA